MPLTCAGTIWELRCFPCLARLLQLCVQGAYYHDMHLTKRMQPSRMRDSFAVVLKLCGDDVRAECGSESMTRIDHAWSCHSITCFNQNRQITFVQLLMNSIRHQDAHWQQNRAWTRWCKKAAKTGIPDGTRALSIPYSLHNRVFDGAWHLRASVAARYHV